MQGKEYKSWDHEPIIILKTVFDVRLAMKRRRQATIARAYIADLGL